MSFGRDRYIKQDLLKHLEKLGKVKVYKKPNFNHEKTQDEYNSAIEEVVGNLNTIKNVFTKRINLVRQRILDICTTNLETAFKHYYNIFTYTRDPSEERQFTRAINELKNFSRASGLDESNQKDTEEKIKWLNNEFSRQARYIQQVEKQIRDRNIEPFTDIVENMS